MPSTKQREQISQKMKKYVSLCPKMQFGQMKNAPEKYGTFGTHGALQQNAQPLSIMMP